MIIGKIDCKHCGISYDHQFSGTRRMLDTPDEYSDDKYCPGCKKAIVDALAQVPVLFGFKHVITTDVTYAQLMEWDDQNKAEIAAEKRMFPPMMRVFMTLWRESPIPEHERRGEIIGRDACKHMEFRYAYWPSEPDKVTITVLSKVEVATGASTPCRKARL